MNKRVIVGTMIVAAANSYNVAVDTTSSHSNSINYAISAEGVRLQRHKLVASGSKSSRTQYQGLPPYSETWYAKFDQEYSLPDEFPHSETPHPDLVFERKAKQKLHWTFSLLLAKKMKEYAAVMKNEKLAKVMQKGWFYVDMRAHLMGKSDLTFRFIETDGDKSHHILELSKTPGEPMGEFHRNGFLGGKWFAKHLKRCAEVKWDPRSESTHLDLTNLKYGPDQEKCTLKGRAEIWVAVQHLPVVLNLYAAEFNNLLERDLRTTPSASQKSATLEAITLDNSAFFKYDGLKVPIQIMNQLLGKPDLYAKMGFAWNEWPRSGSSGQKKEQTLFDEFLNQEFRTTVQQVIENKELIPKVAYPDRYGGDNYHVFTLMMDPYAQDGNRLQNDLLKTFLRDFEENQQHVRDVFGLSEASLSTGAVVQKLFKKSREKTKTGADATTKDEKTKIEQVIACIAWWFIKQHQNTPVFQATTMERPIAPEMQLARQNEKYETSSGWWPW